MNQWTEMLTLLLEQAANIATIVGVIGIIVTLVSYHKSVHDTNRAEQTQLMRNSIDVMQLFTDSFIPQADEYQHRVSVEFDKLLEEAIAHGRERNRKYSISDLPPKIKSSIYNQAQINAGATVVFYKLEQICAYMRCNLVLDDLVYPVLHQELLHFVSTNSTVLDLITTPDSPFINTHFTIDKWYTKSEHDRTKREHNSKT